MNSKKWGICVLSLWLVLLVCAAMITGIIDPFFHFHGPLESLEYPLNNQRYQNDGITRNFSYDALITGTSMAENFKTTEFDALFDCRSIKVCYSGGTYEEITANLQKSLQRNPGIRYVIYAIDEWFLFAGKDLILADGEYPTYLYDENPFNDVTYLLNKEILFSGSLEVLDYTRRGGKTTSFDEYSSWEYPSGREVLLSGYQRPEKAQSPTVFTQELADTLRTNLETNLLSLARSYPETQFLLFFPPYNILNWDAHNQEGTLELYIDAMTLASQILTQADNIQLYSFYTDFDTCTDFDVYRDIVHYHHSINSLLLQRMRSQEYRLTPDNFHDHWEAVRAFYSNYDYESLFLE